MLTRFSELVLCYYSKKPVTCESGSAFGGSSTSGTLTSTDSNVSNRDGGAGTLNSTDSGASLRAQQQQFDVFALLHSKVCVFVFLAKNNQNILHESIFTYMYFYSI